MELRPDISPAVVHAVEEEGVLGENGVVEIWVEQFAIDSNDAIGTVLMVMGTRSCSPAPPACKEEITLNTTLTSSYHDSTQILITVFCPDLAILCNRQTRRWLVLQLDGREGNRVGRLDEVVVPLDTLHVKCDEKAIFSDKN